ncbi:cytochrome b/b6 domain-containing protein [Streptomyces sp. NPDC006670]|uniref:cytochrome b/b6 domain-containing protein n=1 Tax=Streptomyces sp. NPDC006670 TaxID=3154476 RepID=UPI0033F61C7A
MPPPSERPRAGALPAEAARRVHRFGPSQRWAHRATAALMGVCVGSAGCLYLPPLAELVGRRHLVVTVHEWSGLLLVVPVLLGLVSRALRADLGRLGRFGPHDRVWLRGALWRLRGRGRGSEDRRPAGKFNAGQKLYAGWLAGAALVMSGTGLLMWQTGLAPLVLRTGATFLHDWLALTLGIVLAGHIGMAMRDPEARRGLRTGSVDRAWAEREHPLWRHGG